MTIHPATIETFNAGDNVSLKCRVEVVDGLQNPPSVQWFRGSTLLISGQDNIILSTETATPDVILTFRQIRVIDGGLYTCKATLNSAASMQSTSKGVDVSVEGI